MVATQQSAATYDASDLAKILKCSERQVRRLDRQRAIPGRIALGRLVRFNSAAINSWLSNGCPINLPTSAEVSA